MTIHTKRPSPSPSCKVLRCATYIGVILVASQILVGCSGDDDIASLNAYIATVKKRPGPPVEPLPKIALPETISYNASGMRDPFEPIVKSRAQANPDSPQGAAKPVSVVHPDLNRNKEALEGFPLDSLRMVGTMEQHGERWGVVRSPDSKVFMVRVGNFMGQNHGRIEQITETRVLLNEIIPDGEDNWKNRQASITLSDREK